MKKTANIIILSTYWNEIEWVNLSLEQIEKINPKKAIICDGCFDPRYINKSTDGTTEIIDAFCNNHDYSFKMKALRKSKVKHLIDWFFYFDRSNVSIFKKMAAKIYGVKMILITNVYRLNQMATFQHMLTKLSGIENNEWFMTYDCDQFYSDEILKKIKKINLFSSYDILTTKENTFFDSFSKYSNNYEKRDYNNMPHKYKKGMRFIPTRHPAMINGNRYVNVSNFTKSKKYIGQVFHYHIKSQERQKAGYSLGDRKNPEKDRTKTIFFPGQHPKIISDYLKKRDNVL